MARASKMSVQKNLRERKKTEKAALKREQRKRDDKAPGDEANRVADWKDLEGYGMVTDAKDRNND
jgi:hypothetical protein